MGSGKDKSRSSTETSHAGESRGAAPLILNLGTRWGVGDQRHAPAALSPGKRAGAHPIGGWVGPRAGLDG
jgi:hypothetical protein